MKDPSEFSSDELETIRRRLHGKPLVSRANWMARQAAYVLACIAGFVAVIKFLDRTWEVVGLIVVAFLASGVFEVLIDWRYGNYRKEWELANGTDPLLEGLEQPAKRD